jgi:hypothetical protein
MGSLQDLHEAWFAHLPRSQAKILSCLVEVHPMALSKEHLAERVGQSPTSGGYKNNLGALRSLGTIDYVDGGQVVATGLLFPRAAAINKRRAVKGGKMSDTSNGNGTLNFKEWGILELMGHVKTWRDHHGSGDVLAPSSGGLMCQRKRVL